MNAILVVMSVFSVLGAIDLILGNRFGLGAEFERGLKMFGPLALSMLGMLVLAPLIAHFALPILQSLSKILHFEPSVIVGSIFANDMGAGALAQSFATTEVLGYFNGLVVGSMMGATVSFTLPFVLSTVEQEKHKSVMLGIMCGVITIPLGCIVAGLMVGIAITTLLWNLIPLLIFSALLALGIFKFPKISVAIFKGFGVFIKILVTVGLVVGILAFLSGADILPHTAPIDEGVMIVFNVCAVETGAFPLVYALSKLLKKPLKKLGEKANINQTSALGFLATLATSVTTFETMKDMDDKGVVLNSAFAVSAAFTFADHMAYTLSFYAPYLPCVIVGKLVAGIGGLLLAVWIYKRTTKEKAFAVL